MFPVMAALDADKDGTLSEQEIKNAANALKTLDKNNNQKLDPEELRPSFGGMGQGGASGQRGKPDGGQQPRGMQSGMPGAANFNPAQMVDRMFSQNDKNGDGKLSADEIPERMSQMVDRVDRNGDGVIEKSEVEEAFRSMGNGQRPGRGGSDERRDSQGTVPKRPSDK